MSRLQYSRTFEAFCTFEIRILQHSQCEERVIQALHGEGPIILARKQTYAQQLIQTESAIAKTAILIYHNSGLGISYE